MSLNFDVSNIDGYNEKYGQPPYYKEWHPVTNAIVFRMMFTGLGWDLTFDNADEFYARCKFCDALLGSEPLYIEGESSEITPQMIQDHIGLHVNISPEKRESFIKRWTDVSFEDWKKLYKKELGHEEVRG